ncbi:YdeI/OmpD-associated family protein [Soonwooa sp.]|uniref:YdeI/OmpD-associated family protein n=1 Tax=Soonwooa sp. TaxID=1938592 RepID=UPI00262DAE46|nr:YdeI/OmpD-associated family protein [Soonwooa sp.]
MEKTNAVDDFYKKNSPWKEELNALRELVLETKLFSEALKWYQPCYSVDKGNVVIVSPFKEYCALNFFKGALIDDPKNLLTQPTENTQSGRQMRFISLDEIKSKKADILKILKQAAKNEKEGLKVEMKKTSEFAMPEELQAFFEQDPRFKAAFEALTPGRQRGYLLHFGAAKQSQTRISRIEKAMPDIYAGKGFNDRK